MSPPSRRRLMLLALAVGAGLLGLLATPPEAAALAMRNAGPELARVLRGMALIKLMFAAGAFAAIWWRVQRPLPARWALGYGAAIAAMAAGPGLIWNLRHLVAGSIALHAGLLAAVVLLWRDPVVGAQLSLAVDAKRRRLMARGQQQDDQRDRHPLQQNAPAH